MKKFLSMLALLPIALMAVEYEFLTPQVLVLKNPKPYIKSSHAVAQQGCWLKENALARDKKGNILRKADITNFEYIVFVLNLYSSTEFFDLGIVRALEAHIHRHGEDLIFFWIEDTHLREDLKQCEGILSARNSDGNSVSVLYHIVIVDCAPDKA